MLLRSAPTAARAGVWCLLLTSPAIAQAGDAPRVALDGMHKFWSGDNPAWARPEFDDSRWRTIRILGSWRSQGVPSDALIGWYRVRFTVPANMRNIDAAVSLGHIAYADEVFLNGMRLGGEGVIGDRFVEAHVERLYRVPAGLLEVGESNLLAVRVMNTYAGGGLIDGPLVVGEYGALVTERAAREAWHFAAEGTLFALLALSAIAYLIIWSGRLGRPEYLYLCLSSLVLGVVYFLSSHVFYATGLKTHVVQRVLMALAATEPATFLLFLLHAYERPIRLWARVLVAVSLFIAVAILIPVVWTVTPLTAVWTMLWVVTSGAILFLSSKAVLDGEPESRPIFLGMALLVCGTIAEQLGPGAWIRVGGLFVSAYGVSGFVVCGLYAMAVRFGRTQQRLRQLSAEILTAHEEERTRLARELHDGVGQSLLAIKLNLQMMHAAQESNPAAQPESLSRLITEVSGSFDELHRVAAGLRPSYLEEVGIAEALRSYAAEFQRKSGIEVRVEACEVTGANPRLKDHLFRILQEALANTWKHGDAHRAEVMLRMDEARAYLQIKDDGKGFDAADARSGRGGLGLSTIRERAELLGGTCRISSAPDTGTSIHIEVPLHS